MIRCSLGFALAIACAPALAQMPAEIADRVFDIGPVIDPAKTAAIYVPLHAKEPYAGVRVSRDLKYGADERHALDLFVPEAPGAKRPVLVFVHGGAFVAGNKRAPGSPFYDNIMLAAAGAGVLGVNMTYRLAPQHQWPAGPADVGAAVKWVRENIAAHGGDPARIFVMGHSAGAMHVASYVAFPEHHAGGAIGIAGAVLVSGLYQYGHAKPGKNELAYFGDKAGTAEVSSLPGLVRAKLPLLVVHADLDPANFVDQAKLAYETLCTKSRCPRRLVLKDHSHMSEVYAINTADRTLFGAVLDFIGATK